MALINCPECGNQISDKAESCINCGMPITQFPIPQVDRSAQSDSGNGEQVFAGSSRSKPSIATKIIITIIVLVVLSAGGYLILNRNSSKLSLFTKFLPLIKTKDNIQENLVNIIPLAGDLYVGYRAKDGLGNIFRIKIKESFNNNDTSYVFLLSKWHQMGFMDIGDEKLFLIKNQKKLLEIASKDYERLTDNFLDSLDQVITWERDYKIAKNYSEFDFNNVFCLSDKDIIILGDDHQDGKILRSQDAGTTWSNSYYYNTKFVSGSFYFNDGIIIANSTNGDGGLIYKTTDKGKSFTGLKFQNITFISSCFGDNIFNKYYALGYVNQVLKLIVIDFLDPNQSITIDIPNISGLKSITANSGNQIFVTGTSGNIYSTQKLAERAFIPWEAQTANNSQVLNFCYSILNSTGIDFVIAVGQKGTIMKSNNGGKSWNNGQSDTDEDLMQISSNFSLRSLTSNSPEFYIAGRNGTILFSNDFGNRWQKQSGCSNNNLLSVSTNEFDNLDSKQKNIVFVVGEKGTVLRKVDNKN